jgi:hypothetical protein
LRKELGTELIGYHPISPSPSGEGLGWGMSA